MLLLKSERDSWAVKSNLYNKTKYAVGRELEKRPMVGYVSATHITLKRRVRLETRHVCKLEDTA